MPFRQTPSTARRRSMLSNKYRVTTHRSLFSIIGGKRRCQSFSYKIRSMLFDNWRPFIKTILPFFLTKTKPRAKR
ncbi:hypothetical protein CIPOMM044M_07345 [Citrobacter portucalensis]